MDINNSITFKVEISLKKLYCICIICIICVLYSKFESFSLMHYMSWYSLMNLIWGSIFCFSIFSFFLFLEWNFLFKTLTKFNFGENFITWMQILYNNPIFRVKNNGWISKICKMERGIRQGCPVSALLYLFVAEILAIKIKENRNIEGSTFKNNEIEVKSVQHADDLTVSVKNELSLIETLRTVDTFCNHAGSIKMNISKTECLLLGPLKGQFEQLKNIKVVKHSIKCLGIYIGYNKRECYVNNWMKIYHQIEKLFESWKRRKLTIFGKSCIINGLAISKLIYKASIPPIPSGEYIKKITRLLCNFVWKKRNELKEILSLVELKKVKLV